MDLRQLDLIDAYYRWPKGPADFGTWWAVAKAAATAVPLEGADVLAVTALESAYKATSCGSPQLFDIGAEARKIQAAGRYSVEIEQLLNRLINKTVACSPGR